MKSNKKRAIPFQKWASGVLEREIRRMEQPSKDRTIRLTSRQCRTIFANELEESGIKKAYHYIQITYQMKSAMGIDRRRPKDELSFVEMYMVTAAEILSAGRMIQENPQGYQEVKELCVDSSKAVAKAMRPKIALPQIGKRESESADKQDVFDPVAKAIHGYEPRRRRRNRG